MRYRSLLPALLLALACKPAGEGVVALEPQPVKEECVEYLQPCPATLGRLDSIAYELGQSSEVFSGLRTGKLEDADAIRNTTSLRGLDGAVRRRDSEPQTDHEEYGTTCRFGGNHEHL